MLNVAAFHTNYTDLQVQTAIRPGVVDISNAAAATIRGVELEATTLVRDTVQRWGPPGLVGRDLRSICCDADRGASPATWQGGGSTTRRNGRAACGSIGHARSVGAISMSLRADSTWKTTVFFTPFNDSIQQQRPLGLLDFSAELGPTRRRWSVAVYARNLTNEDYITGSTGSPPPAIGGRPGDVRQLGVQWRWGGNGRRAAGLIADGRG